MYRILYTYVHNIISFLTTIARDDAPSKPDRRHNEKSDDTTQTKLLHVQKIRFVSTHHVFVCGCLQKIKALQYLRRSIVCHITTIPFQNYRRYLAFQTITATTMAKKEDYHCKFRMCLGSKRLGYVADRV
jgi:hypothetical protein